jgi:metal-sulfur cluster biosynthetic enzyme
LRTVEIDDANGDVCVTMRLTSPCCAFGPTMAIAAERELGAVAGVRHATVVIDHAAVWTPTEITARADDRLAARRRHTVETTGVAPYDWTTYRVESPQHPRPEGIS